MLCFRFDLWLRVFIDIQCLMCRWSLSGERQDHDAELTIGVVAHAEFGCLSGSCSCCGIVQLLLEAINIYTYVSLCLGRETLVQIFIPEIASNFE
ncbi:hypothetical protein Lalb_Chr19g0133971 [Lupinus albus]|uniref:Uncharacterized protein n=1 Tax=Lupinus albus TaxID=3870 RepID=A0A6A4P2Q4_LUPAL|nr:hypothetical protein Lalb_Chr19g0133971 [Lupinus albus]